MPTKIELKKQVQKIKNDYTQVLGKLLRQYIVDALDTYAVELKEHNTPKIHVAKFSFEDEYNDEGGTYTYLEHINFYGGDDKVINIDFEIEDVQQNGIIYQEQLHEVIRETIRDNFDLDEIRSLLGDPITIDLLNE